MGVTTTTRVMMLIGGVLLGVGLLLGFIPVSASGSSCGSAFVASNEGAVNDYATLLAGGSLSDATARADCEDARSMMRAPALALAVPGALLVGLSLVQLAMARPAERVESRS
jgi:hypothetical protein